MQAYMILKNSVIMDPLSENALKDGKKERQHASIDEVDWVNEMNSEETVETADHDGPQEGTELKTSAE